MLDVSDESALDSADTVPGRRGASNALIFREIGQAVRAVGIAIVKLEFQI
ncbi:hypothetical protein [Paraburkholderia ferrariae]|nr:hypothetical protein [Paraburkholderia ferrariae]